MNFNFLRKKPSKVNPVSPNQEEKTPEGGELMEPSPINSPQRGNLGDLFRAKVDPLWRAGAKAMQKVRSFIRVGIIHPFTYLALIGGFAIGARFFETGNLPASKLRGGTFFATGECQSPRTHRNVTLAEDELKISYSDELKFMGVIRRTKDLVECERGRILLDPLPPLANFMTRPTKIPETLTLASNEIDAEVSAVLHKRLLASGTCSNQEGKPQSPFMDEQIEVISATSEEGLIKISVIRRSDKAALECTSKTLKYRVLTDAEIEATDRSKTAFHDNKQKIEIPIEKETFVDKVVLITSTCFPDPRVPKTQRTSKVVFYNLINSKVQVTEEEREPASNRLVKLFGVALDNKGDRVFCDEAKFHISARELDSDSIKTETLSADAPKVETIERESPSSNTKADPVKTVKSQETK